MAAPLLRDVVIELRGVDSYQLGVQLNLQSRVLDDIWTEKAGCEARRSAVVDTWLRTDGSASWEKLITALERVGSHDVLVQRLKEKYLAPSEGATCSAVIPNHPAVVKFTKEMIDKFTSLVHYVFLNFKRRTVALDEIVVYTSTFRVAGKEHTYQLFPKQYVDQLSEATSLVKVFAILGGYWDFQNYHLLEFLVKKLGDDTAKKLVTGYKEEFAVYQRNVKLLEFVAALPECVVKKEEMDSDKMVVKLPQSWPEASLECMEEFQRRFSDAFGIPLHVVRFDTGEEGSIVLTWLIPPSLSPVITHHQPTPQLLDFEILDIIMQVPRRTQSERLFIPRQRSRWFSQPRRHQPSHRRPSRRKRAIRHIEEPVPTQELITEGNELEPIAVEAASPPRTIWKKVRSLFSRKRVVPPQEPSPLPPQSPLLLSPRSSTSESPQHRSLLQTQVLESDSPNLSSDHSHISNLPLSSSVLSDLGFNVMYSTSVGSSATSPHNDIHVRDVSKRSSSSSVSSIGSRACPADSQAHEDSVGASPASSTGRIHIMNESSQGSYGDQLPSLPSPLMAKSLSRTRSQPMPPSPSPQSSPSPVYTHIPLSQSTSPLHETQSLY